MGKIVFNGHGMFFPTTDPPSVVVPEGTTIYLYTDALKGLLLAPGAARRGYPVWVYAASSVIAHGAGPG